MKLPLRLLSAFVALVVLSGCDPCGNDIIQSVASPSGHLKAVVFTRDCGATTGFSTQVSVLSASDDLPNAGGNTLVLDGQVPVHVQWVSESALRLRVTGSTKVYEQRSVVGGVSVSYED